MRAEHHAELLEEYARGNSEVIDASDGPRQRLQPPALHGPQSPLTRNFRFRHDEASVQSGGALALVGVEPAVRLLMASPSVSRMIGSTSIRVGMSRSATCVPQP